MAITSPCVRSPHAPQLGSLPCARRPAASAACGRPAQGAQGAVSESDALATKPAMPSSSGSQACNQTEESDGTPGGHVVAICSVPAASSTSGSSTSGLGMSRPPLKGACSAVLPTTRKTAPPGCPAPMTRPSGEDGCSVPVPVSDGDTQSAGSPEYTRILPRFSDTGAPGPSHP